MLFSLGITSRSSIAWTVIRGKIYKRTRNMFFRMWGDKFMGFSVRQNSLNIPINPAEAALHPCTGMYPSSFAGPRLYGHITRLQASIRLDAFDTVSPKKILPIPYTRHRIDAFVSETTGCSPVSSIIKTRRLRFFGHVARSDSELSVRRSDQQETRGDLDGAHVPPG